MTKAFSQAVLGLAAAAAAAQACPDLSGTYSDHWGYTITVTQTGCEKIVWSTDYTVRPTHPDPKYPTTVEYITDGQERTVPSSTRNTFVHSIHRFVENALVLDYRHTNDAGYTYSHVRQTLELSADQAQLNEVNVTIRDQDGGDVWPWYNWVYRRLP